MYVRHVIPLTVPSLKSYCLPYFEYCASHDKGWHAFVEFCSGWRGSKCEELSTVVGVLFSWQIVTQPQGHGLVCRDSIPSSSKYFFLFGAHKMHMFGALIESGGLPFLVLVIFPSATKTFWKLAPFLLLIATPPTVGRSLRIFHILRKLCLLILSLSCLSVWRNNVSPSIEKISSMYSNDSLPNSSTSHSSKFRISSINTSWSSRILLHVPTMWVLRPIVVPHERKQNMRIKRPPPTDHWYSNFLFLVGKRHPH